MDYSVSNIQAKPGRPELIITQKQQWKNRKHRLLLARA